MAEPKGRKRLFKMEYMLLIDEDTGLHKIFYKNWLKTRQAILKSLGCKVLYIKFHQSLICKKCYKSWTDFPLNLKNYNKCIYCGSKRIKTGRGYHILIKIEAKKRLKPKSIIEIQYLLGSDNHKEMLGLKKVEKGLPYFNKLFSKVIYRKMPKKECLECGIRAGVKSLMEI